MGRVQRDGDRSVPRADSTAVHFGKAETVKEAKALHLTQTLWMTVFHRSHDSQAKQREEKAQQCGHGEL